jgi:hypothetical protein
VNNVLLSALVPATVVLAGCNANPTPAAVGDGAALNTALGHTYVAGHQIEDGGGDGVHIGLQEVDVEIPAGELNLNSKGKFKVVITTTDGFDASEVDPETVTLGDGRRADIRVHRKKSGKLMARLEDDDGDGDLDLVLHFAVQELVANGDLTESSTELVLEAATYGGPGVHGAAAVTPRWLETKHLLPSSRIDTSLRIALLLAMPTAWQEV